MLYKIRTLIIAALGMILSILIIRLYHPIDMFRDANLLFIGWCAFWGIMLVYGVYGIIRQLKNKTYEGNAIPVLALLLLLYVITAVLGKVNDMYIVFVSNATAYSPIVIALFLASFIDICLVKHDTKLRVTRYVCMPLAILMMITGLYGFPFGPSIVYRVIADRVLSMLLAQEIMIPLLIISLSKETCPDDHMIGDYLRELSFYIDI